MRYQFGSQLCFLRECSTVFMMSSVHHPPTRLFTLIPEVFHLEVLHCCLHAFSLNGAWEKAVLFLPSKRTIVEAVSHTFTFFTSC